MGNVFYYGTKLVLHGVVAWFMIETAIQLQEQHEMLKRLEEKAGTTPPQEEA